jgi:glycerol-3-phosphate dehydrogenase
MQMTMRDALNQLADIVKHGDEALIKDNANDASAIWQVKDEIDPSEDYEVDLVVNAAGIYAVDIHGYVDQVPIYRVMT